MRKMQPERNAAQRQPSELTPKASTGDISAPYGHGGANHCHCARPLPNEPAIGDDHRRVDEAGDKSEGDNTEINDQKARVTVDPGKKYITDAGQ